MSDYYEFVEELWKLVGLEGETMVKKGDKIRLLELNDPYTRLRHGDLGTVTGVGPEPDGGTQISVIWDDGSTLSLIVPPDRYEVVKED